MSDLLPLNERFILQNAGQGHGRTREEGLTMKTRDLYAEIAEGLAALSDARDGNQNLRTVYVSIPGLGEVGPQAVESEPEDEALDLTAGEIS